MGCLDEKVSSGVDKLVVCQPRALGLRIKAKWKKTEPRGSILVTVLEFLDDQRLTLFNPVGK